MLKIEHLTKVFGKGTINEMKALDDVNFHGKPGDFITIIGSNGAGKSTLMNSIAGVFPVDSGRIEIDGKEISGLPEHKRAKLIGRVFQDPMKGTAFDMTIEENLSIAYNKMRKRGFQAGINKADRELFREKLTLLGMGLENRMKEKVRLLSGGQRQRVLLAKVLAQQTPILFLDEPATGLDLIYQEEIFRFCRELCAAGKTVLMVVHELALAARFCSRLLLIGEGRVIADGNPDEVLTEGLLERAYGTPIKVVRNPITGHDDIFTEKNHTESRHESLLDTILGVHA